MKITLKVEIDGREYEESFEPVPEMELNLRTIALYSVYSGSASFAETIYHVITPALITGIISHMNLIYTHRARQDREGTIGGL